MYIFSLCLPMLSFVVLGLLGASFKKNHLIIFNILSMLCGLIISCFIFYEVIICAQVCEISLWEWLAVGNLRLTFQLYFDALTGIMLMVVYMVSFLVHLYSVDYMKDDPYLIRFLSYLSLFTFFMLVLITGGNLVQLFLGWEGVGLSSYLLINFWHTRIQANKSAIKAIIVNRFGDFGLYFALCFCFLGFNTFDFNIILSYIPKMADLPIIDIMVLLLLLGAVGKSAQIGLHTWLADAMEGPTPVSALIHAATMVTAGIVLLIRANFLLEHSKLGLFCITIVGALTVFFAGTIGIFQNDIKKIIAFSTCSQLGYMLFACGLSAYNVSLFHLFNHAFFKALLFLGAGSIIHAMGDEQDIRKLGGLVRLLPVTYISMFIGSLSLMGIPFLSGFYSKDLVIEIAASTIYIHGIFIFFLVTLSVLFTAFYSVRLIYYVFYDFVRLQSSTKYMALHESDFVTIIVLVILAILSIFSGYWFKDLFIGPGMNLVWALPINYYVFDAEFGVSIIIKLIPLTCTLIGSFLSFHCLMHFVKLNYKFHFDFLYQKLFGDLYLNIYRFFNQQWYFNYLYNSYIVNPILWFGYVISLKLIDRGFLEYFGPFGIVNGIRNWSIKISRLQTGYIFNYIVVFIISIFILFMYLYFCVVSLTDLLFLIGILVIMTIFNKNRGFVFFTDKIIINFIKNFRAVIKERGLLLSVYIYIYLWLLDCKIPFCYYMAFFSIVLCVFIGDKWLHEKKITLYHLTFWCIYYLVWIFNSYFIITMIQLWSVALFLLFSLYQAVMLFID